MRKLLRFVLVCLLAAGCFRVGGLLAIREPGAESLQSIFQDTGFWQAQLLWMRGAYPQTPGLLRQMIADGAAHFFRSGEAWLFPAIRAIMAAE